MMNIALALGGLVNVLEYVFHSSNMRIRIDANRYGYPDLSLVRVPEVYEDHRELALLNPIFVLEVTSPSSLMRDRVEKPDLYFAATSIEAYLIVDQDRPRADLYARTRAGMFARLAMLKLLFRCQCWIANCRWRRSIAASSLKRPRIARATSNRAGASHR